MEHGVGKLDSSRARDAIAPTDQSTRLYYIATVFGTAIYLYLNLFVSGDIPFLLGGDQVYFWMFAQRLLHGEAVYRDFFQYTPPGTDLVYAAAFKIFGTRLWVPNAVVFALGIAFSCVCFSLSRKLMKAPTAVLATALFQVLIYGKVLNATNHWFAVLLVLTAVLICMDRVSIGRISTAGAFLGFAAFFNQAHGGAALLGFSTFLVCRSIRARGAPMELFRLLACVAGAFTLTLLSCSMYFLATAGFAAVWYCLVTYVAHYSSQQLLTSLGLPGDLTLDTLPMLAPYLAIYILLPGIYSLSLWQCWRLRKNTTFPWHKVALLSSAGLSLLLEVAVSINWLRLFAVSLLGIVLAVRAIDKLPAIRRSAAIVASIGVIGVAAHQIWAKRAVCTAQGELPAGRVATLPQSLEKLRWLAAHTRREDFFFQAGGQGVYLPLQLRNPLYLEGLDANRGDEMEFAIRQMEARRVRYVLWTHALNMGCQFDDCNDGLSPFRRHLMSSYTRVHIFEDGDVLWQRLEDDESVRRDGSSAKE